MKYDTGLRGYRTGIRESQLREAPEFSDELMEDRDWETKRTNIMAFHHIGALEVSSCLARIS